MADPKKERQKWAMRKAMAERNKSNRPENLPTVELADSGNHPHYKVSCRDCTYARDYGAAPITASVKADTHCRERGHVVFIRESNVYLTYYPADKSQEELPF